MAKLPGVPREPGQGRLRRPARPGAQRLGRDAPDQPGLRGRPRGREVAPPPPTSAARCRWGSTATSSTRRSGSASACPGSIAPAESAALQPGPGVAQEVVDARRQAGQRAARQDRPRQEGRRGLSAADRRQGRGCASSCRPRPARSCPHTQIAEMIKEQWRKIGIQADVKEMEREPRSSPGSRTTSTRSRMWANDGTELLYSSRATRSPSIRSRRSWARRSRAGMRRGGKQGKAPDGPAAHEGPGAVPLRRRQEDGGADTRSPRRSGRSWSTSSTASAPSASRRPHGRAHREPQAGQHPVARRSTPSTAARPGTSHPATFYYKA